jgi:hypothetical protein
VSRFPFFEVPFRRNEKSFNDSFLQVFEHAGIFIHFFFHFDANNNGLQDSSQRETSIASGFLGTGILSRFWLLGAATLRTEI